MQIYCAAHDLGGSILFGNASVRRRKYLSPLLRRLAQLLFVSDCPIQSIDDVLKDFQPAESSKGRSLGLQCAFHFSSAIINCAAAKVRQVGDVRHCASLLGSHDLSPLLHFADSSQTSPEAREGPSALVALTLVAFCDGS